MPGRHIAKKPDTFYPPGPPNVCRNSRHAFRCPLWEWSSERRAEPERVVPRYALARSVLCEGRGRATLSFAPHLAETLGRGSRQIALAQPGAQRTDVHQAGSLFDPAAVTRWRE